MIGVRRFATRSVLIFEDLNVQKEQFGYFEMWIWEFQAISKGRTPITKGRYKTSLKNGYIKCAVSKD